jgi:hypothetical protein
MARNIAAGMAAGAYASGITSCANVPATGSFTTSVGGNSVTIAWATPTHVIPTGYTGAGTTYEKRANMTMTDPSLGAIKTGMEWTCGQDGGYMELSLSAGGSPQYPQNATRVLNIWVDSANSSNIQAEFIMDVTETATPFTLYDSEVARINIDNTANTFKLWAVNTFNRSNTYNGYRLALYGSPSSNQVSAYLDVPSSSASLLAGSDVGFGTPAPSSYAFHLTPSWTAATLQGCLNFSTQVDPASTAQCASYTLATPSAPLVDPSTGAFDYDWVENTLPGKISVPSF